MDQRMHHPSLPFIYVLENPIKAESGTFLIFQPFNTHNRVSGHEFKHTYTHVHKMNTHTSRFFLVSLKALGTWGVPVDTVAKRMMESWSENVLQQASMISRVFSPASDYISSTPLLLILACPWGWFTQIMLM